MEDHEELSMDAIEADLKETLEGIGKTLEPDGDWIPVLVMYRGEQGDNAIIGIPELGDKAKKHLMAELVLPRFIKMAKPQYAALVTMGWAIQYDQSTLEGRAEQARDEAKFAPGEIEPRPSKYECLAAYIIDKNGKQRQMMAYVHRYPTSSPVLQWHEGVSEIPEGKSGGRFPDAMRAGMEQAWKTKE